MSTLLGTPEEEPFDSEGATAAYRRSYQTLMTRLVTSAQAVPQEALHALSSALHPQQ